MVRVYVSELPTMVSIARGRSSLTPRCNVDRVDGRKDDKEREAPVVTRAVPSQVDSPVEVEPEIHDRRRILSGIEEMEADAAQSVSDRFDWDRRIRLT